MNNIFARFKETAFFGRSYDELLLCFGYRTEDLVGKRVLDCPAGPASFVAEANERGIHAVGVDPRFYRTADALGRLASADYSDMYRKIRDKEEFFVAKTYPTIDACESSRYKALERFLEDYRLMYPTGRYMEGQLPDLSFDDDSYDIALCGHLLFIYEGHFDFEFHLKAILELCRVAKEEVRIHPIVDGTGHRHQDVDTIIEELSCLGFQAEVIDVDHEFFRGANQTLIIRK